MENSSPPEVQKTVQKINRFRFLAGTLIVLFVAAVGVYSWVYLYKPCDVNAVKEASNFLISQLKTYDAQYEFTTTVYPSGLMHPVNRLQQIFMDTQSVDVPVCMQTAKEELLGYMGTIIRAFQAFEAGENDSTIRDLLGQSDRHYAHFRKELDTVNKCAPFCVPKWKE